MNFLAAFRRVLKFFQRETRVPQQQAFSAYCADCGGKTLVRSLADGRITCPQCNR